MRPPSGLKTPSDRLKWWRINHTNYATATDAARAISASYGIAIQTYLGHENGSGERGIGKDSAGKYSLFYKISVDWLLYNIGRPQPHIQGNDEFSDFDPDEKEALREYAEFLRSKRS